VVVVVAWRDLADIRIKYTWHESAVHGYCHRKDATPIVNKDKIICKNEVMEPASLHVIYLQLEVID
jgi:hypothetical protein